VGGGRGVSLLGRHRGIGQAKGGLRGEFERGVSISLRRREANL